MLLVALAQAGAPTAVVLPSSAVEGSVSVAIAPADAIARLEDPTWVRDIDGGGTRVSVRSREGSCLVADFETPSSIMTVRYTVRQCRTERGNTAVLLSSEDLDGYESEWIVSPDGSGSLLTYRVKLTTSLPVPRSLISATMRSKVEAMMQAFAAKLGTPG